MKETENVISFSTYTELHNILSNNIKKICQIANFEKVIICFYNKNKHICSITIMEYAYKITIVEFKYITIYWYF